MCQCVVLHKSVSTHFKLTCSAVQVSFLSEIASEHLHVRYSCVRSDCIYVQLYVSWQQVVSPPQKQLISSSEELSCN